MGVEFNTQIENMQKRALGRTRDGKKNGPNLGGVCVVQEVLGS